MKLVKRTIALIAMLAMSVACVGSVYAANSSNVPQASPTLTSYGACLDPGSKRGELDVSFDVTAAGWADSLGVAFIEFYTASNKKLVDTVYCSESNGLMSSGFSFTNTYTYSDAIPGVDYYAIVSIYAQIGTTFDSRVVKTSTVRVPTSP